MKNQPSTPWAIRSTLIAVTNLDRSIAFYRDIGPFDEVVRDNAIAVLGDPAPQSITLVLREARGIHPAHGQQTLGVRSMTFKFDDPAELDRVESVLREHDRFIWRRPLADGVSHVIFGHDPDNLPLLFVYYPREAVDADYYRVIADLFYAVDI